MDVKKKVLAGYQQGTKKVPTRHQQSTSKVPEGSRKVPRKYQAGTKKAPARYQGKAYLGDKIGKSDYVDKHVASAVESVADLRRGLVFKFSFVLPRKHTFR